MRRLLILASLSMLVASPAMTQPSRSASGSGSASGRGSASTSARGSVRHSSNATKKKAARTTSPRAASPRATSRRTTPARRQGYRSGYRRGRYHGWHDARRSWRRWRTVTGLFRLGVYAATRPRVYTTVVVSGTRYYYSGGVYYVSSGSGYVVVAAPRGAVVYSVPTYTTVVYSDSAEYLYVNGTYYVPTTKPAEKPPATTQTASTGSSDPSDIPMIEDEGDNYEVVAAPVGATVPYLPDDADEETIGGKRYFVSNGTYYQPFAGDGETIYMVVADPRGSA